MSRPRTHSSNITNCPSHPHPLFFSFPPPPPLHLRHNVVQGRVAQRIEHRSSEPKVRGSIPLAPTSSPHLPISPFPPRKKAVTGQKYFYLPHPQSLADPHPRKLRHTPLEWEQGLPHAIPTSKSCPTISGPPLGGQAYFRRPPRHRNSHAHIRPQKYSKGKPGGKPGSNPGRFQQNHPPTPSGTTSPAFATRQFKKRQTAQNRRHNRAVASQTRPPETT